MPRDCCVALPCGAMGLSSVCDCDIFCSFSLTIFKSVLNDNAPVICNHGSLPLRRVGESWANVPYFYLCIVSIVWGNAWELIYLGKHGSAMSSMTACGGGGCHAFTRCLSPQCGVIARN